ncbi:PilZ domain-containing protein [Marichromatium sp. AB32]|nr:PilZ domain-containing protein [Marichromatium sp. AB32]
MSARVTIRTTRTPSTISTPRPRPCSPRARTSRYRTSKRNKPTTTGRPRPTRPKTRRERLRMRGKESRSVVRSVWIRPSERSTTLGDTGMQLQQLVQAEKRTQRRIPIQMPIDVLLEDHPTPLKAINQDLSWGGARFVTERALETGSNTLRLFFPWQQNSSFCADAEIVRREALDDGRLIVATRFFRVPPMSEQRLEMMLAQLGGQQAALPLSERLELVYNDPDDICDVLRQIAAGGLMVTTTAAYREDQSIRLSIAGTEMSSELALRARVIDQARQLLPGHEWAPLHQVELRFEHSVSDLYGFIRGFAQGLPEETLGRDRIRACASRLASHG